MENMVHNMVIVFPLNRKEEITKKQFSYRITLSLFFILLISHSMTGIKPYKHVKCWLQRKSCKFTKKKKKNFELFDSIIIKMSVLFILTDWGYFRIYFLEINFLFYRRSLWPIFQFDLNCLYKIIYRF